jgi:hypothetical protein
MKKAGARGPIRRNHLEGAGMAKLSEFAVKES